MCWVVCRVVLGDVLLSFWFGYIVIVCVGGCYVVVFGGFDCVFVSVIKGVLNDVVVLDVV